MKNITRRTALKGACAATVASVFPRTAPSAPVGKNGKRPSILFILVDQLHHRALSGLGNRDVQTPNIDRLIREGTQFDLSYCAAPVCIPCRSALMSGRMPTETGVWVNTAHQKSHGKVDNDIPTIGEWLRDRAGYETIYAGKWHLHLCHTYNIKGFEVIASGAEHRGDPGDSALSRACEAFLYNRDPQAADPFFMVCSMINPHDVCNWLSINTTHANRLARYPHLEEIAEFPELPANAFTEGLSEPKTHRGIRQHQQPSAGDWKGEDWRYYMWAYYRQVEMVDREIGRVLDALEDSGLAEDTLVVFTSDHGEGLSEHQMVRKGFLYDSAARVPLVYRYPGVIDAGAVNKDQLVGSIDFVPTVCDFASVAPPPGLQLAKSLYPVLTGSRREPLRKFIVTDNNEPCIRTESLSGAGRQVRTKKYKYITYDQQDIEQLFDMENDPGETQNLAGDSQYQSILNDHRNMLLEWEHQIVKSPNVPESPWKKIV